MTYPKNHISPDLMDKNSLLPFGPSVNGLAFTFRIAYQNSTCSIFVLMLIHSDNKPTFFLEGFAPYYDLQCRLADRIFTR